MDKFEFGKGQAACSPAPLPGVKDGAHDGLPPADAEDEVGLRVLLLRDLCQDRHRQANRPNLEGQSRTRYNHGLFYARRRPCTNAAEDQPGLLDKLAALLLHLVLGEAPS